MQSGSNQFVKVMAASLMFAVSAAVLVHADSAGRKALESDPRYQRLETFAKSVEAVLKDLGPQERVGAVDSLRVLVQIESGYQALLPLLKAEAEACGHCQPAQGKYDELAEEWGIMRAEWQKAPGLFDLVEAIRTGNWTRPPLTEEQLQQLDTEYIVRRVGAHCTTVYSPDIRIDYLAPGEKRQIQSAETRRAAFNQPWVSRLHVCQAELNGKVLYAQHRLAMARCLTAHDFDKVQHTIGTTAWQLQAEKDAFNKCMNENDIATAACTEDLKITYWTAGRRNPESIGPRPTPCVPVMYAGARVLQANLPVEKVMVDTVRAYSRNPATMAEIEKTAAGATPATLGLNVNIPFPADPAPPTGTPVNALGVPVGAKFPITTLEPIDLMHVSAARRYRARLTGPAEFRGRYTMSKGIEVALRAYRQETTNPRIITVSLECVSATIDSKTHPLPAFVGSPELQAANAGAGLTDGQKQTVLPAGANLQGHVVSSLRPRTDDPADADSPLLKAAVFPTEDPNFLHPAAQPETSGSRSGTERPKYTLAPGGLNPPVGLPLPVVVVDPIDLGSDDETLRFRAQTAQTVRYGADVVLPEGADVFLKVIRKGRNALFYQVVVTVDSVVVDGKKVPVRTSQIPRSVGIRQAEEPAARTRAARLRTPVGTPTLPAGTRLSFSILPVNAQ